MMVFQAAVHRCTLKLKDVMAQWELTWKKPNACKDLRPGISLLEYAKKMKEDIDAFKNPGHWDSAHTIEEHGRMARLESAMDTLIKFDKELKAEELRAATSTTSPGPEDTKT